MTTALGLLLVVALGIALLVAIVRPTLAFVLIVCMPVVEQALQGYFPVFIAQRALFNFAIAGIAAASLAVKTFRGGRPLVGAFNPAVFGFFGLYALSWASLVWTADPEAGREFVVGGLPYAILYMVIAPFLVSDMEEFARVRFPLMIVGSIALGVFVLSPAAQIYGTRLMINYGADERGNPGALGELGALVLIVAVLTRAGGLGRLAVPLQLGAGLIGFGVALLSGSRGQVLAGGALAILLVPLAQRVKSIGSFFSLVIGFFAVGGILYAAVRLFVTSDNVGRWDAASLTSGFAGRLEIVMFALDPFLDNPAVWPLGRGAGAFQTESSSHAYPHNAIVEVLTELGFVGLLFYGIGIFFVAKSLVALWRRCRDDDTLRSATAILIAAISYWFLLSLKQNTVHMPSELNMWYLLAAIIAARADRLQEEHGDDGEWDGDGDGDGELEGEWDGDPDAAWEDDPDAAAWDDDDHPPHPGERDLGVA